MGNIPYHVNVANIPYHVRTVHYAVENVPYTMSEKSLLILEVDVRFGMDDGSR